MESDRHSPVTSLQSKHIRAHFNSPSVESPSMVPSASTEVGQSTNPSLSHVIRDDTVGVSELAPRHLNPTSCVGHIRERCQHSHPSGTATDLALSSWRKSYQSLVIPPSINGQTGVMNGIEISFVAL